MDVLIARKIFCFLGNSSVRLHIKKIFHDDETISYSVGLTANEDYLTRDLIHYIVEYIPDWHKNANSLYTRHTRHDNDKRLCDKQLYRIERFIKWLRKQELKTLPLVNVTTQYSRRSYYIALPTDTEFGIYERVISNIHNIELVDMDIRYLTIYAIRKVLDVVR